MKKFLLFFVLMLVVHNLYSQTASQPLELPNFIIEGKEQIDVQVGTKQIPLLETYLARNYIDSLIIVGKPRNYVVFPVRLPNSIIARSFPSGYVDGNIGSFFTTNISAGYKSYFKDYEVYTFGNFGISGGHIENANYTKFAIGLQTDYIAPEKFYIFGKSKTTTNVDFDYKSYRLYATSEAPRRNQLDFSAKILSIGHFEGYDFQTGARFYTLNLASSGNSISENLLGVFLEVVNKTHQNKMGGKLSLDFRSTENKSTNFFQFEGCGQFVTGRLWLEPKLGFQLANSGFSKTRAMVLLDVVARTNLNENFSLFARFANGLQNKSIRNFFQINPYISDSFALDFCNATELQAKIKYQPNRALAFVLSPTFFYNSRFPVLNISRLGYFDISYIDASIFTLSLEGYWIIEKLGTVSTSLSLNATKQNSNNKDVPTYPVLQYRIDYSKVFWNKVKLAGYFEYLGRRYADLGNSLVLTSFGNLGLGVEYKINNSFVLTFNGDNLLNSNIVHWYGYKEWGLNLKLGLIYKF
ncbi:MAG: hypothetical protein ACK42Z_05080 [Candidatus Kapaibacteriota bacterium]